MTELCRMRAVVDAHFEARISPSRERKMRAHLPECADCRAYYERHLLLARIMPDAPSAERRLRHGLGLRLPGRGSPRFMVAAAAFSTLVFAIWSASVHHGGKFTARGAPNAAAQLIVFRVAHGRAPEPARGSMSASDELSFAYRNASDRRRLLVFGVDEHRRVYWYHPAWTDEREDPHAITIESDGRPHELGAAILQPLDGRVLRIYGIFTNRDLSVREVEALEKKRARVSDPFALPDATESVLELAVEHTR
jgi:hypothetical protein